MLITRIKSRQFKSRKVGKVGKVGNCSDSNIEKRSRSLVAREKKLGNVTVK